MTNLRPYIGTAIVSSLIFGTIGFGMYRAVRADRAIKCCTITREESLELDDELQKALRVQDEFNRQYAGGFLGAAARICKAHGWDCPAKVVFDPRTFSQGGPAALSASFHEIPPPINSSPERPLPGASGGPTKAPAPKKP